MVFTDVKQVQFVPKEWVIIYYIIILFNIWGFNEVRTKEKSNWFCNYHDYVFTNNDEIKPILAEHSVEPKLKEKWFLCGPAHLYSPEQ